MDNSRQKTHTRTIERRIALREKIALVLTSLFIVVLFCVWLEFITALFCDPPPTYEDNVVYANSSRLSSINGVVVDWQDLGNTSQMTEQVNRYPHYDLSPMFPNFMQLQRPADRTTYNNQYIDSCINGFNRSTQADNWLKYKLATDPGYKVENNKLVSCPYPTQRNKTGASCFYSIMSEQQFLRYPKKGVLKFDAASVYNNYSTLPYHSSQGQAFVILDGTVLDITDYLEGVTNVVWVAQGSYSRSFAMDRMFLPLDLTLLLYVHMGEDITQRYYKDIKNPHAYRQCLHTLFYHGVAELEQDIGCAHINLALWITLGCFLLYFLVRMNLAYLSRLRCIQKLVYKAAPSSHSAEHAFRRTLSIMSNHRHLPPYTLLFIPCFAESSETLRQTFDSLARTNYPDTRKLLCFVCDGLVKSKTDTKESYLCILDALGYSSTKDPELRSYISLGQGSRRINYAKVYAGFYESGRNRVPFLLIVKVGAPHESLSTTRVPGNRGKRDSMLMMLGFLERCMNLMYYRITPLEFELFNLCYNLLGIDPRQLKYMLVTDADIQVQDNAICRLASRLEADPRLMAVSGHIRPANPEENIVTMLQIIPLYLTQYAGPAFEACLGTVTTIHGGFVMYRLWSETNKKRTITFRTKMSFRRRVHKKKKKATSPQPPVFSLAPNSNIEPCCIQPTVLRGLAAPKPSTMHMENLLLLGEEQYFSIVLLRSNPNRRLAFEPEAVGYAVLPTHFLVLQALAIRHLRTTFHFQLEFQHVAKHLGWMYWIVSLTKLLDTIFTMPLTAYLYSVYIRYFTYHNLAFAIIVGAFTSLILLHVIYFILRRQFKYTIWLILYCLFAVPFFNIWFVLLSVWHSNTAYLWYDVWPTQFNRRHRLHGILMDAHEQSEHQDNEDTIPRMRLTDFEVLEAEKIAQREKEQAEMLDAKFNGFQGYVHVQQGHASKPSWSSSHLDSPLISSPPLAQIRDKLKLNGSHSRFASDEDARRYMISQASSQTSSPRNPFVHVLDDMIDTQRHRKTRSQSSYFSHTSQPDHQEMFMPPPVVPLPTQEDDTESIISLSNSVISFEQSHVEYHGSSLGGRYIRSSYHDQQSEGRDRPVHSRYT
ncbi:hypothetical protein CU098_008518 [Rhizopus stolonifer]|uniref:chitin synthase n=1 Tax=Rhizopus stolonifer TaxID=4846 RepID=A0A367KN41_RHIST|nr:hypothetical protein CU098_008518 [Rhizopus stolonifer]